MKLLSKLEKIAATVGGWLQSPLLFVLRVWWGWQFCRTGWGKLMHLGQTADFFASLGIPLPQVNAAMAGTVECVGGALLLIGLFSRLVSVPLLFTMAVAFLTAERKALLGVFNDPDTFTSATPFLFALVALLVLAFGPGAWSVDAVRGSAKAN